MEDRFYNSLDKNEEFFSKLTTQNFTRQNVIKEMMFKMKCIIIFVKSCKTLFD